MLSQQCLCGLVLCCVALFLCAIWLSVTNDVKTQMLILDEAEENLQANEQINQLIHGELKNKEMEIIK